MTAFVIRPLALPLGELSPQVTERVSGAGYPLRRLNAASSPKGGAKGAAAPMRYGRPPLRFTYSLFTLHYSLRNGGAKAGYSMTHVLFRKFGMASKKSAAIWLPGMLSGC